MVINEPASAVPLMAYESELIVVGTAGLVTIGSAGAVLSITKVLFDAGLLGFPAASSPEIVTVAVPSEPAGTLYEYVQTVLLVLVIAWAVRSVPEVSMVIVGVPDVGSSKVAVIISVLASLTFLVMS